jgi:hypothetical protein
VRSRMAMSAASIADAADSAANVADAMRAAAEI